MADKLDTLDPTTVSQGSDPPSAIDDSIRETALKTKNTFDRTANTKAQVHLTGIEYAAARREYLILRSLSRKRRELLAEVRREEQEGAARLENVHDAERTLFSAQVQAMQARARLLIAHRRIVNTLGRDFTLGPGELREKAEVHAEVLGPPESVAREGGARRKFSAEVSVARSQP